MGLFDLFRKKTSGPPMEDLVWLRSQGKFYGLLKLLEVHPDALVLSWFEDTLEDYTRQLADAGRMDAIRSVRLISAAEKCLLRQLKKIRGEAAGIYLKSAAATARISNISRSAVRQHTHPFFN